MGQEVRIKLSMGLIAAAAVHALLLAGVFEGLHNYAKIEQQKPAAVGTLQLPTAPVNYQDYSGPIHKLQEPPPQPNAEALAEKKSQISGNCVNCVPTVVQPQYVQPHPLARPQYVQPSYVQPSYSPGLPIVNTPTYTPTYVQPAQPTYSTPIKPERSILTTAQSSTVPRKFWQLSVFVGSDERSKTLLSWINTDPQFVKMRNNTDVQIYAKDDLLYRTRYASVIPVEQFPAIVLTDSSGGHVHAAGGNMIPRTSSELYADFVAGGRNYLEAKKSAPTQQQPMQLANGLIKSHGYSWDNGIHPAMQLMQQSTEDCPGGQCPPDRERATPLRDLFDNQKDSKSLMTWIGNNELATLVVLAVCVGLVVVIVRRQTSG
jgi:hypothetical protein